MELKNKEDLLSFLASLEERLAKVEGSKDEEKPSEKESGEETKDDVEDIDEIEKLLED